MIGLGTLLVFIVGLWYGVGLLAARTMAFTTLVFSQLFHVFDCKSERRGIFEVGIFSNPLLVVAVMISVTMQLSVIYFPFLQSIFKTAALEPWQWLIILLVAGGPSVIIGLVRLFRSTYRRKTRLVKTT